MSDPLFTNRLAAESSPYLLQHAHNPVDWYPWGDEAFRRARDENKPVFLSIGYSACHWCHVMEHESFESPMIAKLLNDRFVSIKVDREERPDVDDIYMTAVQMMTGSGGWPLSLFLLPDGRPFYGGTYFPPESRYNRIGFSSLLTQIGDAWISRRAEVEESAASIVEEIQKMSRQSHPAGADEPPLSPNSVLARVVGDLGERFDAANGGFGGAPKFPPHHALRLLILAAQRGEDRALPMLRTTLDRMAIGGLYDQVGGGFHRYATDAIWLLPHFEKMLYDNALLARVYAQAFVLTGETAYARIARETCEWMLRDLLDSGGGFQAALDADSEGEEGKYYVWTRAQVGEAAAGQATLDWSQAFRFAPGGNFRDEATGQASGANIPHLGAGDAQATLPAALPPGLAATRDALLARRYERVPPNRDDKVITAWNGLAIGALAVCGQSLVEESYVEAARRAANFCLTTLCGEDGRLLRRFAKGRAGIDGFLDDYAFLADGLLDLFEVTGEARYGEAARDLTDTVLDEFADIDGGFFSTADHHETLIARTRDLFDGALPSANGVMARVLSRLAALPNGERYAAAARRQQDAFGGLLARAPEAVPTLVEALILRPADDATPGANPAEITLSMVGGSRVRLRPGERGTITFRLMLPPELHIGAADAGEYPTVTTFSSDAPASVGPVLYPVAQAWTDPLGENLAVYRGGVTFTLPIAVVPEARSGDYSLTLAIDYQACSESACHAPTRATATVEIAVG